MDVDRHYCPMRHENGNCLPCGGFCASVNNEICQALHNAYIKGYDNGVDDMRYKMSSKCVAKIAND